MDFSVIKELLCEFLEREWDHKFLIYQEDPWGQDLRMLDPTVVTLPFNPTAENLAGAMLDVIGPKLLEGTGVTLIKVTVEETAKCWASAILSPKDVPPADIATPFPKITPVGAGDGNTYVR
jgi:6-pyruvoyltetrahydropterin/6-carboxytetrahydropterin synthase